MGILGNVGMRSSPATDGGWAQEEAAAGQQLLACINALPLCGGQAALPITQSFVGQLVALMLHLNRCAHVFSKQVAHAGHAFLIFLALTSLKSCSSFEIGWLLSMMFLNP